MPVPAAKTTISIDFWNTLVRAETGGAERRNARIRALHEITSKNTDESSAKILEEAKLRASKEFDLVWFGQQRTPTTRELVDNILGYLNISVSSDERGYLVEAFEESLWAAPPEFIEKAKETLPVLAGRYPLALISDTMYSPGRVIRDYLEAEGVLDLFSVLVFSDETGYSKPNPRAYLKVLESTGSAAEHSWHIGDLLKTDIAGAQKVDMNTIHYIEFAGHDFTDEQETEPDHTCKSWDEIQAILY